MLLSASVFDYVEMCAAKVRTVLQRTKQFCDFLPTMWRQGPMVRQNEIAPSGTVASGGGVSAFFFLQRLE